MDDLNLGKRIVDLRRRIVAHFDVGNWEEVGLLTDLWEIIEDHPRLLRSLSWNDSDYSGHVLPVLREMVQRYPCGGARKGASHHSPGGPRLRRTPDSEPPSLVGSR